MHFDETLQLARPPAGGRSAPAGRPESNASQHECNARQKAHPARPKTRSQAKGQKRSKCIFLESAMYFDLGASSALFLVRIRSDLDRSFQIALVVSNSTGRKRVLFCPFAAWRLRAFPARARACARIRSETAPRTNERRPDTTFRRGIILCVPFIITIDRLPAGRQPTQAQARRASDRLR